MAARASVNKVNQYRLRYIIRVPGYTCKALSTVDSFAIGKGVSASYTISLAMQALQECIYSGHRLTPINVRVSLCDSPKRRIKASLAAFLSVLMPHMVTFHVEQ